MLSRQTFDAIVSDIFLGDKDGIELLEKSRKRDPDTPFILVTGLPTVETASAAVHFNAYGVSSQTGFPGQTGRCRRSGRAPQSAAVHQKAFWKSRTRIISAIWSSLWPRAPRKLIESNQRFQLLFENSKDAIYMAAWNGRFLALNQSAQQLFGYNRGDLMKKNTLELYAGPQASPGLPAGDRTRRFCKGFFSLD